MSPRLRDESDTLAVLIQQVADAVGVRASFVEKDFWAIEVLRAAQTTRSILLKDDAGIGAVTMLFKGGHQPEPRVRPRATILRGR